MASRPRGTRRRENAPPPAAGRPQSMAMERAPLPAAKGDPETAVNAPVAESTLNTETLRDTLLAAYTNLPAGSAATATGDSPALAVEDSVRKPELGVIV